MKYIDLKCVDLIVKYNIAIVVYYFVNKFKKVYPIQFNTLGNVYHGFTYVDGIVGSVVNQM